MEDIRSEQTATTVFLAFADPGWMAGYGSMLPQSLSWIQWEALGFAQLGQVTFSMNTTASSQILWILWIPPKFFLGHFSISPLLESWPCCSLYFPGVEGQCFLLIARWQAVTPQVQPFRLGVKLFASAFVWSLSFHFYTGYILGYVVKPVGIPITASCRHDGFL